jgi:L-ascorbate metabolism protein UlaG (beta-lactamase superfamily)
MRAIAGGLAAAGGLLLALACRLPVDTHSDPEIAPGAPGYGDTLQVRYLGVAGFLIRRGDDVVLTAPLYSNPDLAQEAFGRIHPDETKIRRFHPADAPAADAILVGHAHYDHLMDVPYVWQLHPGGRIYGSSTTRNILLAYDGQQPGEFPRPVPTLRPEEIVALDDPQDPAHDKVDTRNCAGLVPSEGLLGGECAPWPRQAGDWEYVKPTLRIRALCARHPPQFPGIHQAPGCANTPRTKLPERAVDYPEGPPLVFLVDFLDAPHGKPAFRVYFQDVPSDGVLGKVPEELIRERAVDLALLCVGTWNLVEHQDAPTIIRNLRPQHVMLGHWEDFFRDQSLPPSPAPAQPVGEFYEAVQRELRALHCPGPPTLSLPAPQLLRVFPRQTASCTAS